MRVKREPKPIEVKCIDCPEVFIAYGNRAKRCPVCRKKWINEQAKNSVSYMRKLEKNRKKETIYRPKMTVREVLRELEIYNKVNGTHLSYGQFIVLLEKGA